MSLAHDSRTAPGAQSAARAFGLPLAGVRMLWRERSLWPVAVVPLLLTLVALIGTASLLAGVSEPLHAWLTNWMPVLSVERWYEWAWVGPARAGLFVLGWALFVFVGGVALVGAFLLASVAASPFHEVLSRRVEQILVGRVDEAEGGLSLSLRDALRGAVEELRRLAFFVAIQVALAATGFVIPLLAPIAAAAMAVVTIFFLPLDYASYVLDRRRLLRFRDKRSWLARNRLASAGFGAAAFAMTVVPGLNFVAMPALVVGGTLLALRSEGLPEAAEGVATGRAPAPAPGTATSS